MFSRLVKLPVVFDEFERIHEHRKTGFALNINVGTKRNEPMNDSFR